MFVELHILQNFAPANLNRDDTGMPKDCQFGGHRRARISSQCFKRAVRVQFETEQLLEPQFRAVRTKRVVERLAELLGAQGRGDSEARAVVRAAIGGVKLEAGDDDKTQYLLFLGDREIFNIANICSKYWDELSKAADKITVILKKSKASDDRKKKVAAVVPKEVSNAVKNHLDGGKAVDLALFGRMITDLSDKNMPAASQVAHAISTNRMGMELDYYTAVDDLLPEDTAGADMIGDGGIQLLVFLPVLQRGFGAVDHEPPVRRGVGSCGPEGIHHSLNQRHSYRQAEQHGRPQSAIIRSGGGSRSTAMESGQCLPQACVPPRGRRPCHAFNQSTGHLLGQALEDVRRRRDTGKVGRFPGRRRSCQPPG